MTLTLYAVVDRGAPSGERRCDCCHTRGERLREIRVPYSGSGAFHRDACPDCIDRLRRMPKLPTMEHANDRTKVDRAWEKALASLRQHPSGRGGSASNLGLEGVGEGVDTPGALECHESGGTL